MNQQNEEMLEMVKSLALTPSATRTMSVPFTELPAYCEDYCVHCDSRETRRTYYKSSDGKELVLLYHKEHCPVLKAQLFLSSQGQPVNVYKLSYERVEELNILTVPEWTQHIFYVLATNEDEAHEHIEDVYIKNVIIEYISPLPTNTLPVTTEDLD